MALYSLYDLHSKSKYVSKYLVITSSGNDAVTTDNISYNNRRHNIIMPLHNCNVKFLISAVKFVEPFTSISL